MGYRSDVAYTIRFVHDDDTNNKQSFYVFLTEAKVNAATAPCFVKREWLDLEIDEARHRINFSCDAVKWYESFPDVQCHEALLSLANEWVNDEDNNSGIAYIFVRIGEDADDVEQREGGDVDYSWVQVCRSIDRDW